jgi:hypothetical protein
MDENSPGDGVQLNQMVNLAVLTGAEIEPSTPEEAAQLLRILQSYCTAVATVAAGDLADADARVAAAKMEAARAQEDKMVAQHKAAQALVALIREKQTLIALRAAMDELDAELSGTRNLLTKFRVCLAFVERFRVLLNPR